MGQGRSCSIQMLINLKIVTCNSWLFNFFMLILDYVYVCPGMLCIYLYAVYAQEFHCCTI